MNTKVSQTNNTGGAAGNIAGYGALSIALLYALFGAVWILFSDHWITLISSSASELRMMQSRKGLFFVAVTALLLYVLVYKVLQIQARLSAAESRSQHLFRRLFNTSPEAQLLYDPQTLDIIEANKQAVNLFNLQPDKKYRLQELIADPDNSTDFFNWLKKSAEPGEAKSKSFDLVKMEGGSVHVSVVQQQMIDDLCRIDFMLIRDMSEIRRYISNIEHAAKRLNIAREVSGMGCWEIDLKRNQIFFCNNVSEVLNLPHDANTAVALDELEKNTQSTFFKDISQCLLSNAAQTELQLEQTIVDKDERQRHLLIHAQLVEDNAQPLIIGTFIDQTEQKEVEHRLRQRENQLKNLLESLPEGVVVIKQDKAVYANQAVCKMFHVTCSQDILQQSIYKFVQPHDLLSVKQRVNALYQGDTSQQEFIHRYLYRQNGEPFEAEIAARIVPFQGQDCIQIVIRDLTESLQTQKALTSANQRLASLSAKTLEMVEAERKRIAGELHDDVGQSLTAIKLALRWLSKRLTEPLLLNKVEAIQQICAETLETVRNLSMMLRPAQLDSLGLAAAIKWQADRLFSHSNIQCSVQTTDFSEIDNKSAEIVAFRIAQESLTNIVRHAEATQVQIRLTSDNDSLVISILDNGLGFDTSQHGETTGLANMRERAELLGGTLTVRSLPNVGTEINARLPLRNKKTAEPL